jgi:hypothetical protein
MSDYSTPDWPFADPKNVACFTTSDVMDGILPILSVWHDEDDGAWQFLASTGGDINKAMVVSLSNICEVDPTVFELADLPFGWHAERKNMNDPWVWSEKE